MPDIVTITGIADAAQNFVSQFTFDILNAPGGIPIHATQSTETLLTRGVDGTVYRAVGRQFQPFVMSGVKFHATFESARKWQRDTELLRSAFVQIDSARHGVHDNVYCAGAASVIQAAEGVGNGIPLGTQAMTLTNMSMVLA